MSQSKTPKHKNSRRRVHTCSLCKVKLGNTSFSEHYCQTDIPIESSGIIKNLLKKNSELRRGYPEVQHAWADPDPKQEKQYLLKIKAPLNIIPQFTRDLQTQIREYEIQNQTPKKHHSRFQYNPNICSFYNSPDGCTNENCQREHIDDPEEKKRLLQLKEIIDKSKVLNEPIKAHYLLLDTCEEETRDLNEEIQENFECLRNGPYDTQNPEFDKNINYVRQVYQDGHELEELRSQLKNISRKCYTNTNPQLLVDLQRTIDLTAQKMESVNSKNITVDKMWNVSHRILQQQFLANCSLVI